MDDRGVVLFNLGQKCLVRLCVSLWSLRKHYDGPVAILNGGGDNGICSRIGAALGASVVPIPIKSQKRNTAYCTKSGLWRYSPYETTLMLDSDTVVQGDVSLLFDEAAKSGLVVTRFSEWLTSGKLVSGRILKWDGVKCDGLAVQKLIRLSLDAPHGAINTGVVCWHRDIGKAVLQDWESLTRAGWRCPFTDELAAQLLIRIHQHTMVDCRYNFSPRYPHGDAKPVIIHCHGSRHLSEHSRPYWLPEYNECIEANCAGIRDWQPAGDESLDAYLKAQ